jgi:hypothetical protein
VMGGFPGLDELFEGRHFDREIIVLCVRWYPRFELNFRDLVEIMAERGLSLAHTTIMRWIHHYAPEFERRCNRFARPAGPSWRVDEAYVKIRGRRVYLYSGRSRRQHCRLSPQHEARCRCSKGVLSQGDQQSGIDHEDHHIRRLCGIASRSARHKS